MFTKQNKYSVHPSSNNNGSPNSRSKTKTKKSNQVAPNVSSSPKGKTMKQRVTDAWRSFAKQFSNKTAPLVEELKEELVETNKNSEVLKAEVDAFEEGLKLTDIDFVPLKSKIKESVDEKLNSIEKNQNVHSFFDAQNVNELLSEFAKIEKELIELKESLVDELKSLLQNINSKIKKEVHNLKLKYEPKPLTLKYEPEPEPGSKYWRLYEPIEPINSSTYAPYKDRQILYKKIKIVNEIESNIHDIRDIQRNLNINQTYNPVVRVLSPLIALAMCTLHFGLMHAGAGVGLGLGAVIGLGTFGQVNPVAVGEGIYNNPRIQNIIKGYSDIFVKVLNAVDANVTRDAKTVEKQNIIKQLNRVKKTLDTQINTLDTQIKGGRLRSRRHSYSQKKKQPPNRTNHTSKNKKKTNHPEKNK